MELEFLPEARNEFAEAVEFYEDKEPELGKRFKNEIEKACSTIVAHPLLWREREGGFAKEDWRIKNYSSLFIQNSKSTIQILCVLCVLCG